MKRRVFPGRVFLGVLIFVSLALPAGAQGFRGKISWFVKGSVLLFPEDNGMHSDPMPVLPSPGFGLAYAFTDSFRAELGFDFYYTHYGYSYELDRAVPYAIENRSARVIGSLLAIQAAWYFAPAPLLTIRVSGGPAADLRIVFIAEDLNEGLDPLDEIRNEVDSIRNYFWSGGRWFMPTLGVGADLALNSRFKLGLDLRAWAPAYRLWTGEDLPAIEGWRFSPGLRLTIRGK